MRIRIRRYSDGKFLVDVEMVAVPCVGDGLHLYGELDGLYDVKQVEYGTSTKEWGSAKRDAVLFVEAVLDADKEKQDE